MTNLFTKITDTLFEVTGLEVIRDPLPKPKSEDEVILDVPGYCQTKTYSCGYNVALIIAETFYPDKNLMTNLYYTVKPDSVFGTSTDRLIKALRKFQIGVSKKYNLSFNKISKTINSGHPIITTVARSEDELHWVVIAGYGKNPNRLFIAGNGLFRKKEYNWDEFTALWGEGRECLVCWGKEVRKRDDVPEFRFTESKHK